MISLELKQIHETFLWFHFLHKAEISPKICYLVVTWCSSKSYHSHFTFPTQITPTQVLTWSRNQKVDLFSLQLTNIQNQKKKKRKMCTCVCLMCLGDKLPGLFRLLSLSWDGVERRLSFSGGLAGRTGTAPGKTGVFFLLEGGTREGGNREGTDSFSRAL